MMRRLMAVLAHPGDESLGVGGTLARYTSEAVTTALVTATRGDRGRFGDARPVTLGTRRGGNAAKRQDGCDRSVDPFGRGCMAFRSTGPVASSCTISTASPRPRLTMPGRQVAAPTEDTRPDAAGQRVRRAIHANRSAPR